MYFIRLVLHCADWFNDFLSKNCPYIAGAIAFYTLFSLFPLFLAIISILGYVLGPETDSTELAVQIAEVIPISTESIGETVEGVVRARAITGIASILGLLWAASAVFGAIRKGINYAWGIRKTRRFLQERLMDVTLVLGAGMLVLLVLFTGIVFGVFREVTDALVPEWTFASGFLWGIVAKLVSAALAFLTFLLLYRYLPNTTVRFSDVWPGALAASLAFSGTNWVFVWYVQTFPVYNIVYGSVGAVLALLTWVYLSAIILLFGALVTSRYAAQASRRDNEEQGLKMIWAGLSRVRLRVVESPAVA